MTMSVGDIIQITDVQNFLSQMILNVYFYKVNALEPLADYGDVSTAFVTGVMEEVESIQHSSLIHTSIIMRNLTNGLDIFEESLTGHIGEITTGEALPSIVAAGYRMVRSTALTRHGAKRIAGMAEGYVNGNLPASGFTGSFTTIAHVFSDVISVTGTVDHDLSLQPVIVGRVPSGEPHAGELDLTRVNPISGAQFVRLTSQVTRRAGRGT